MMLQCHDFSFTAMGSGCAMKLYAGNRAQAWQAAYSALASIQRLEQRYSRYLRQNILAEINRIADAGGSIRVDTETAALLDYAERCYQQSDGLFDITSGVLRKAWNFKSGVLPEPRRIASLLTRVGWHKVVWKSPQLSFRCRGMELDLGGIVKEYAADQCATICLQHDIHHGLINLGGDIRIVGPHPDGRPWLVGIRDPRDPTRYVDRLEIHRGGVCSSGDYERCLKVGERYFSHILNPITGWPVNGLASVTVAADFCLVAGSVSTIAMLKEEAGKQWLQQCGLQAHWTDIENNSGYLASS